MAQLGTLICASVPFLFLFLPPETSGELHFLRQLGNKRIRKLQGFYLIALIDDVIVAVMQGASQNDIAFKGWHGVIC